MREALIVLLKAALSANAGKHETNSFVLTSPEKCDSEFRYRIEFGWVDYNWLNDTPIKVYWRKHGGVEKVKAFPGDEIEQAVDFFLEKREEVTCR